MAKKIRATLGFEGHLESTELSIPDAEPPPWDADSKLVVVSQRVPRVDGVAKVTGRARYTYDVGLPGMLFGSILRSPHPAARIVSIDVKPARQLSGVKAVWAQKVGKRVLYAGQEVAAVAATTAALAQEALARIKVEYQPLPFVIDATRAREPGAPLVFDAPSGAPPADDDLPGAKTKHTGNVRSLVGSEPPGVDIAAAFREAEVVVEGTYRTQVQTHAALETHGTIARWEGDRLTLWTSTQATFGVRDQIAQALRIPKDKVRVICEYMGGGFGAKFMAGHWSVLAARMARDARAPVKIMLSRHEEHLCTGNRPDSVQTLKIGAKKDGTLVALHLRAYGTPGVGTGAGTGGPVRALYKVHAWKTEEEDVFTNAGGAAPFRAPGHPQGCFALEQAVDELAEKLGMDPAALRKKNVANPIQVAELDLAVKRAAAWKGRKRAGSEKGPRRRGVGLACGLWYKTYNPATQVQIDLHDDGRVEVKSGAQDIGTGTRTVLAQVTAEELGLPLSAITVDLGDTTWPIGPASGGSSTTPSLAPTCRAAAHQARGKILELAAVALRASPDELEIADGRIHVSFDTARAISWKQAAERMRADKTSVLATRATDYRGFRDQTGGVQIAEVEVDVETGEVRVHRVTVVQDCGRVINRLLAESQVNGGVIQGVSYALLENRVLDHVTGRMVNADLESYKIAGANDCPEIDVHFLDVSNGFNNAGVMGLGEPPTVPTAAAIANAVYNAIGVRMRELPITPDRVLAALAARRGK